MYEPTQRTRYRTLLDALEDAPLNKPYVTMWNATGEARTATFGEFKRIAESKAAYFRELGLVGGDTVIIIMQQGIEQMATFVGAMMLGAIPAILAFPNSKAEPVKYRTGLEGVSRNLRAKLIVLDEAFPAHLMDYVVADHGQVIRGFADERPPGGFQLPYADVDAESLAFIQHSAGTTGLQKGVALSHGAVLRFLDHLKDALKLTDDDIIYSWLPLYHDMGLIACFILPLIYHAHVVMQSPTEWVMQPATMLQVITEYRCTLAWVPNFTFQFLARRVRQELRAGYDLSSMRCLINCSEPVRAQSMKEFLAAFTECGFRPEALQSSYGFAENVFAVTHSVLETGPRCVWVDKDLLRDQHRAVPVDEESESAVCLVSSGRCIEKTEARVVSPDGDDLPDGRVGEIIARSDCLFDGYYNRDDLTANALKGEWYWSGDLGFRLDGEFYVIGRKKDLMIVAGKNIYPQDVEEIAFSHALIHDGRAVAFSVFNPEIGTEDIIIVAEVDKVEDLKNAQSIERALRNSIVAELGVSVGAVYIKPPGWIVKSTAGKPGRSLTRNKLVSEHPNDFEKLDGDLRKAASPH